MTKMRSSVLLFTLLFTVSAMPASGGEVPFSLWKLYRNLEDPLLVRAMLLAGAPVVERSVVWENHWQDDVVSRATTAEAARILIEAGAEIHQPDILMQTQNGDVLEALLAAGADVNAREEGAFDLHDDMTLLHHAPDAKAARLLLAAGLSVEGRVPVEMIPPWKEEVSIFSTPFRNTYYTPLCCARNADVTRVLLAAGADPRFRADDGMTPLHFAPDAESVRLLLKAGADAKAVSDKGLTPLHDVRDAQSARLLLDAGADVNAVAKVNIETAVWERSDDNPHPWLSPLASVVVLKRLYPGPCRVKLPTKIWPDKLPTPEMRVRIARVLIDAGAKVNVADKDGVSLLMLADSPEMAELLIATGADVNARDSKGHTPLMIHQNPRVAAMLITAGADVHAKDNAGHTPLDHAESVEMVRVLMAAGADPLATWENPLFHICDLQTAELYLRLLGDAGRDVKAMLNERGWRDHTPLTLAASRSNPLAAGLMGQHTPLFRDYVLEKDLPSMIEDYTDVKARIRQYRSHDLLALARLFVAAGAKISAEDAQRLLHVARKPVTLRWLIAAGADINEVNANGKTLLHRMISEGAPAETVRVLLEAGAEVDTCTLSGDTPLLLLAKKTGEWESQFTDIPAITQMLIDAGADVRVRPDKPEERKPPTSVFGFREYLSEEDEERLMDRWHEPLHMMADWEAAQVLIDAGADVNALTEDERTPLHLRLDSPGVARVLIAAGADVNARDGKGRTPLFYTTDPRVAKLLVDAGADVNAKDNEGVTPLLRNFTVAEKRYLDFMAAAGADFRVRDNTGRTLLHRDGINDRELWQIRYLLAKGVDVNAKNDNGDTPLHGMENPAAIMLLLDAGADPNVLNEQGDLSLCLSSLLDPPILKRCLAHGLNPNLKLYNDFTLLHEVKTIEAAKLLLDAGADINAKTEDGETPLTCVMEKMSDSLRERILAGEKIAADDPELREDGIGFFPEPPNIALAEFLVAAGAEYGQEDEDDEDWDDNLDEEDDDDTF